MADVSVMFNRQGVVAAEGRGHYRLTSKLAGVYSLEALCGEPGMLVTNGTLDECRDAFRAREHCMLDVPWNVRSAFIFRAWDGEVCEEEHAIFREKQSGAAHELMVRTLLGAWEEIASVPPSEVLRTIKQWVATFKSLYVGGDGEPCPGTKGVMRIIYHDRYMGALLKRGARSSWTTKAVGPRAILLAKAREELSTNNMGTSKNTVFVGEYGIVACEDDALYKVVALTPGVMSVVYKRTGGMWEMLLKDAPNKVQEFVSRIPCKSASNVKSASEAKSEKSDANSEARKSTTPTALCDWPVVKLAYARVKDTAGMEPSELGGYLNLCISRNRKVNGPRIINTRLADVFGQPLYILDLQEKNEVCRLQHAKIVDTLAQARGFDPTLTLTEMPREIQWTTNYSDYVWNSTIPVAPLTTSVMDHICERREERLPAELRDAPVAVLAEAIMNSVREGAQCAARDISYALPQYSLANDDVTLLLPLRVGLITGGKPVAAMVFAKQLTGYNLRTIVTLDMARRSVRMLRPLKGTWLEEV